MTDSGEIWRWLSARLESGNRVALLIVVDSRGSSPGKAGSKMGLTLAETIGTVGGGAIEAAAITAARKKLLAGEVMPEILNRAHHSSQRTQPSGMICGGEQTVLVFPCWPEHGEVFRQITDALACRQPLVIDISEQSLQVRRPEEREVGPIFVSGGQWCYRETIEPPKRAYIIGGGHVGLALAKILQALDFELSVIDQREIAGTPYKEDDIRRRLCIPYAEIGRHIPDGDDVYVFIVTNSHQHDKLVLAQMAGKRLAYLGLLGSRHKIDQLKRGLAKELSGEFWQQLHAPMGLEIGSHTPAEIAISVAAEVVQMMRSTQKRR